MTKSGVDFTREVNYGMSKSVHESIDRAQFCSQRVTLELQKGIQQERIESEQGTGRASKKHSVMFLHATAPEAIMDGKREDMVVKKVVEIDSELSCAAINPTRCWSEL